MNKSETKLDVIIIQVGGSLSGLMHGIVLKRMGHNVWILERSPSALLAEQGAGIGVSDDLEAFMEEYDLVRAPYMLRSPEAFVVDSQGSLITTLKPGVRATSWNTLYYRLRGNFDGLKGYQCEEPPGNSASDGRATYLYGRTLLSIDEEHERLVVKYHHDDDTSGSMSADLVIAADGTGSTIRGMMEPQAKRRYVGYCAWRGTILEQDMGQEAEHLCHGSDRHCQIERSFFLSYTIPGKNGSIEVDKRLRNWVWYCNYAEDSEELRDIMTDCDMIQHRFSLPLGKMREHVWIRQKELAHKLLDRHSAGLIEKTEKPFIQAITEALSPRASFFNGRLLLVGDALATLRPLSGQGTNQSARSAVMLKQVLQGRMSLQQWEQGCLQYAQSANRFGIEREKQAQLGLL